MKFWAKVEFKEEDNAKYLIRAFFQNFNSESSIVIKGKEAKLKIVFDEPSMEIIEAIKHCNILEFNYGNDVTEYKAEKPEQVKSNKNSEKVSVEGENLEHKENVSTDLKNQNPEQTTKKQIGRPAKNYDMYIPELEEIAKKATSFEDFVKLISEWLEMNKRKEFFQNLAIASTEVDKISWKELENILINKGIKYSEYDIVWIGKQISKKLQNYSVTTLTLLNKIGKYKQNFIHKKRVKMECMPEIKSFEETLGSVDKTQTIEERVCYVLKAMGFDKKSAEEQEQISEITNAAIRKEKIDFDIIFEEIKIPKEERKWARMTFSKFIDDFAKQYGNEKKIKLLDFLSDLQKIIMSDSEIEKNSNFAE